MDKHKYGVKMSGMPGNFEHSNIMLEACLRQIYQWTALSSITIIQVLYIASDKRECQENFVIISPEKHDVGTH